MSVNKLQSVLEAWQYLVTLASAAWLGLAPG